ncbi:MAG: ribonuclease HII [Firmicutes bacterium HGW-Firmicutes-13]|nr:MAG: ribonuclease HII [Firmicutes bacterium HGW-Firmicutes-13]
MKKFTEMTIKQISCWLENNTWDEQILNRIIDDDSRRGVHELVKKRLRELCKEKEEQARLNRILSFEKDLWEQGCEYIAGVDEAGKGPLAGPVAAAAVILPKNKKIKKVNDSKQLAPHIREELFEQIKEEALDTCCEVVDVSYIDTHNIYHAGLEAMKRAVSGLKIKAEYLLTDAYHIPGVSIPQKPINKGDTKSLSIACASIVAKVTRDKIMEAYDRE